MRRENRLRLKLAVALAAIAASAIAPSPVQALDADVSYAEAAKLLATQGRGGDEFGFATDLDGDTLIVGAWGDDDLGSAAGSATICSGSRMRYGMWSPSVAR